MKIVAGLGNPGREYRGTRHNVGFEVVDLLARRHALEFESAPADALQAKWRTGGDVVLLVKPLSYMNVSGRPIAELARYYRVQLPDLIVLSDDVNLPLGRLRLRPGGSEGGHNGLRSVAEALGTVDYPRLRVGVGRGDARRDLADHVLARFDEEELPGIERAIARAADVIEKEVGRGAIAPLVGGLVWGIGLSLGGTTGYAINPARDLGPRLAHAVLPIPGKGGSDWGYAWVPVVGPILGASVAALLAKAVMTPVS